VTAIVHVLRIHSILSEYCLRSVGYDVRALQKDKLNPNYSTMINDEKAIIRSLTDFLREYKVKDHDKAKGSKLVSRSRKKQGSTSTLCMSTTSESEATTPQPQGTPNNPTNEYNWYDDDDENDRVHTYPEDDYNNL